jgi:FkbM family methyltransferase
MTTKFFILSKTPNENISNNENNQIVYLNNRIVHILPEVNIDYYCKYGLFENQLIEWCKQFLKKDKVFLDIGAHSGTYSLSLADYCKEVWAFEPQKMTYYSLCGGVALSNKRNITCKQIGLGSKDQVGYQTLNIVSSDGGGSSLHSTSGILCQETIEIVELDSFNIENIGFIKMDVEENEMFVLQGATETLRKSGWPTIIFESNNENQELFNYIQIELNYRLMRISGVNNMYLAVI